MGLIILTDSQRALKKLNRNYVNPSNNHITLNTKKLIVGATRPRKKVSDKLAGVGTGLE